MRLLVRLGSALALWAALDGGLPSLAHAREAGPAKSRTDAGAKAANAKDGAKAANAKDGAKAANAKDGAKDGAKAARDRGAKAERATTAARGASAPKRQSKPPAKQPAKAAKELTKAARKPGSAPAQASPSTRAAIAGEPVPTTDATELKELRELDDELFPEGASLQPIAHTSRPAKVIASGMPPLAEPGAAATFDDPRDGPADVRWMAALTPPDLPFRWDARLIRYLDHFKSSPKGRASAAALLRRLGRYEAKIREAARAKGLPEDLVMVALVESAMNPRIASRVGAAGLWQFMPKTAENYGLRLDRWVDERLDPERSTDAGLNFLRDLHARFGRWELALAAYNMGHGGLLSSIRKYNTNDFWELSELEAGVPYETALYVPKILALAFVARNRAVFGCEGIEADAPLPFEVAMVKPGTTLDALAKATGRPRDDLEALNPQLVGGALPPVAEPAGALALRVPPGTKGEAERPLARTPQGELEAVTLRWGESLESIAAARGTTESALRKLNAIGEGPPLRPGARVLAPKAAMSPARGEPTVAVVPSRVAEIPGKKRAFYEVTWGDELGEVARVLGVSGDELVRWNNLDRGAKLHARMVLQAFVGGAIDPAKVRLLGLEDVRVFTVGTDEFFDHFEAKNHRKRVVVTVAEGDTFRGLAKRHGLTLGMLERINHRSREAALVPGERLVVYARRDDVPNVAAKSSPSQVGTTEPAGGTTSAKTLPPSDDAPDAVVDERADDGL